MKDTLKKVVILDNLASPYVCQAIIVMRDYEPRLESRAVLEAERIVNSYLDNMKLKSGRTRERRVRAKGRRRGLGIAMAALLLCVAAAAAYYYVIGC